MAAARPEGGYVNGVARWSFAQAGRRARRLAKERGAPFAYYVEGDGWYRVECYLATRALQVNQRVAYPPDPA